MEKQKCPACGENTIDFQPKYFLHRQISFKCEKCGATVSINVFAHLIFLIINLAFVLTFINVSYFLGLLIFFFGNLAYSIVMMIKAPLVEKK